MSLLKLHSAIEDRPNQKAIRQVTEPNHEGVRWESSSEILFLKIYSGFTELLNNAVFEDTITALLKGPERIHRIAELIDF